MKICKILTLILLVPLLGAGKQEINDSKLHYTIFLGGDIITMKGDKPKYAQSVVIKRETIVVTVPLSEVKEIAPKSYIAKVLKVNTQLPGLIDAHARFTSFLAQAIGEQILPLPDAEARDILL
ncbi:hypothetical protein [Tenacibaculum sp. nBUS_03]|uniref:hypothetical protein n=1 Tax=Tenacibaculum sp. nBUS_03 TaxID=3395320 RepID=UPI003EB6CB5B